MFAEEVKINVDCELVVMAGVIASKVRKQRGAALKDKEDDPQAAKILNVSIVMLVTHNNCQHFLFLTVLMPILNAYLSYLLSQEYY